MDNNDKIVAGVATGGFIAGTAVAGPAGGAVGAAVAGGIAKLATRQSSSPDTPTTDEGR